MNSIIKRLSLVICVSLGNFHAHCMEDKVILHSNQAIESSLSTLFTFSKSIKLPDHAVYSSELCSSDGSILLNRKEGKLINLITQQEIVLEDFPYDAIAGSLFSPDDKSLLVGLNQGEALLWDIQTGVRTYTLNGHEEPIQWAAFSSDGTTLITGSVDCTIFLWNAITGKDIKRLENLDKLLKLHNKRCLRRLALSPNGASFLITLLKISGTYTSLLFNSITGNLLREFSIPLPNDRSFELVQELIDSETLFVVMPYNESKIDYKRVYLLNVLIEKPLLELTASEVKLSPDRKIIITWSSEDKAIVLWSAITGKKLRILASRETLHSLRGSPDSKTILIQSHDDTIQLLSTETGKELQAIKCQYPILSAVFSFDGNSVFIISGDKKIHVWCRTSTTSTSSAQIKKLDDGAQKASSLSFTDGVDLEDDSQKECSIQ